MKDTNRAYRNAVLDATRPYADAALYEVLIPVLTKSKDAAAQTDLIAYFGCRKAAQALPAVLDRFNDADAELSAAAMWAATRIGGMEVPAALAAVLGGEDAARIAVAEACLASYKGNIDAVVAPVAENGSVQGRGRCARAAGPSRGDFPGGCRAQGCRGPESDCGEGSLRRAGRRGDG